jgi:hypothetical protein
MIDATVAFGPYRLDLGRRILSLNGKRVVLPGRAPRRPLRAGPGR